jgi:hypothetical protein
MYQDLAGADGPTVRRRPPPQLINASWFMYGGAVISAIVLIIGVATIGSLKSVSHRLASSQLNADVGRDVVLLLLVIGLWVWMGWANRRGRSWARIVATVLFGLYTLRLILFLRQQQPLNFNLFVEVLTWLVGLGAIILAWHSESSAYYRVVSATRRHGGLPDLGEGD